MATQPGLSETKIWRWCAAALGWEWSPAHNGWISDHHVDLSRYGEGGHPSDMHAEDACFLDGVDTLEQAAAVACGEMLN